MRSLILNHSPSLDDVLSSSGLNKKKEEEEEMSQKEVHKDSLREGKPHFVKTMTSIAQYYVGVNQECKGYSSKEKYLGEASKKYFFLDSSYPSMRLFEFEDDHGKYIEEKELWRPLPGMQQ